MLVIYVVNTAFQLRDALPFKLDIAVLNNEISFNFCQETISQCNRANFPAQDLGENKEHQILLRKRFQEMMNDIYTICILKTSPEIGEITNFGRKLRKCHQGVVW